MEEVYKTASCFTVDKYHLSKLKDDEAFKEFIIKDLSNRLADNLVDILSSEGEVLVKMSGVYCHENDDFATVDYRQYLKWSHLVRCKDCKYYLHSSEVCGIIDTRLHFYETDKRWFDDCFCSWGERKETEDE